MSTNPTAPNRDGRRPNLALIGRMRTGKDTAANHLTTTHGYTKIAFADTLRTLARETDPTIGDWDGRPIRYTEAIDSYGYEKAKDHYPDLRRFLQRLGCGVRDTLGADIWVEAAVRRIRQTDGPIVVTDCRFPNEAAALHDLGFTLIRLHRPATHNPTETHVSETHVDQLTVHRELMNDGTVTDLEARLDRLVAGAMV